MAKTFEQRLDQVLENAGHWKKWDGKEPIHLIVDPKSWPEYEQMDPRTGRGKKKKSKRIAGKL
jgi:hypothetical protein